MIDNGIVQITIANPEGYLTGVSYGGVHNILEYHNKEPNRGYAPLQKVIVPLFGINSQVNNVVLTKNKSTPYLIITRCFVVMIMVFYLGTGM